MNVKLNAALGFRTRWGGSTGCIMHRVPTSTINCVGPSVRDVTVLAAFSVAGNGASFFFPPFSSGLPRVNTRVFFSPPFSSGLPKVNTKVFFPALFQRAAQG